CSVMFLARPRLRTSAPFLPTVRILTVLPSARRRMAWSRAMRAIEELNPPARPRSPVATTRRLTSSLPVPAGRAGASGQPCKAALKEPGALPYHRQDLDGLACGQKACGVVAGHAGDRGVESPRKAALAGGHHQEMDVVLARSGQKRRRVGTAFIGRAEAGQHL